MLDSTINIPPLIYQNQGGIVGIYVARDVDFSSVYELRPTAVQAAGERGNSHEPALDRRRAAGPRSRIAGTGRATPPRSSSSCARLREQLDAPGVLEVCVNRPGELLVETVDGWQHRAGAAR